MEDRKLYIILKRLLKKPSVSSRFAELIHTSSKEIRVQTFQNDFDLLTEANILMVFKFLTNEEVLNFKNVSKKQHGYVVTYLNLQLRENKNQLKQLQQEFSEILEVRQYVTDVYKEEYTQVKSLVQDLQKNDVTEQVFLQFTNKKNLYTLESESQGAQVARIICTLLNVEPQITQNQKKDSSVKSYVKTFVNQCRKGSLLEDLTKIDASKLNPEVIQEIQQTLSHNDLDLKKLQKENKVLASLVQYLQKLVFIYKFNEMPEFLEFQVQNQKERYLEKQISIQKQLVCHNFIQPIQELEQAIEVSNSIKQEWELANSKYLESLQAVKALKKTDLMEISIYTEPINCLLQLAEVICKILDLLDDPFYQYAGLSPTLRRSKGQSSDFGLFESSVFEAQEQNNSYVHTLPASPLKHYKKSKSY